MLRWCSLGRTPRHAFFFTTLPFVSVSHRRYFTGYHGTLSYVKGRRYYTDPLRAPKFGVRTLVGRFDDQLNTPSSLATAAVDAMMDTTTTHLTTHGSRASHLIEMLSARGRTVRYDSAGVPVEGSWYLLPWREQMRILAAAIGAFCITKAFFDMVRFELLYYGIWKLGYRNDDSFTKRMLYYGSTALLAAGLFFNFNLNFFLSAWVMGRREMAAHMVCNGFAHLMPHRTIQLLERRLKLSLV